MGLGDFKIDEIAKSHLSWKAKIKLVMRSRHEASVFHRR
jgi:hypothetical protein